MKTSRSAILPIMLLTVFLDLVGLSIAIPIFPTLMVSQDAGFLPAGMTESSRVVLYGFLMATYPLFQFFGSPILGALADRHGRRPVLIVSLFGTLVGYILTAVSIVIGSLPLLIFSRAVDGFTGGNISVAHSVIADITEPKSRAKNFGLMGMMFGLGFILGPLLGGLLADPSLVSWFTLATPFWFGAALAGINMLLVFFVLPETLRSRINFPISLMTGMRNIRKAWGLRRLRTAFIVVFLHTLGFTFFTQFVQIFMIDRFAFDQRAIGFVFSYVGIWIAVVQGGLTGLVSRRFDPPRVLPVTLLGLACAIPALLLASEPWMLYAFLPFVALFQGLTHPNSIAIVSNLSDDSSQGEVLGINQSVAALAMTLPPLIAGFVAAIHPELPLIVAGGIIACAWVAFVIGFRGRPEPVFKEV